jgi:hypothetical protein
LALFNQGGIFVTDQEKELHNKTSIILGKDTINMKLNEIIEELVNIIETKIENN